MKSIIFDFNGTLYNHRSHDLFEETIPVLQKLQEKGHQIFIVSTAFDESYREVLEPYCEKIKNLYPKSKDAFKTFLIENNIDQNDAVIVGDYEAGEIQIGKDLEIFTIWFDENSSLETEQLDDTPLWKINSLEYIPTLV